MKMFKIIILSLAFISIFSAGASAKEKIKVVTSFSILNDMAREVGGDKIELSNLVPPDSDAHAYEPAPADIKLLHSADIAIVNGLHYESWLERLVESSGFKGRLVTASDGIIPFASKQEPYNTDPHAWQDVKNGEIYVKNICTALIAADPENASVYKANAAAYIIKLNELDGWIKAELKNIPAEKRRIITSHDAFGYFSRAYDVEFIAPLGISTESEASASDIAKLIDQIRAQRVKAVFIENISDPRLAKQLQRDAGAAIGGTLYSDALSATTGPAATYIDMFRNNVSKIKAGISK